MLETFWLSLAIFNFMVTVGILYFGFQVVSTLSFVFQRRAILLFLATALFLTSAEALNLVSYSLHSDIIDSFRDIVKTAFMVCALAAVYFIAKSEQHQATALLRLSEIDTLTELKSIPYFRWVATQVVKKARKDQVPLVLISIAIDDFNAYTHEFGQEAGNTALQRVARTLRDTARTHDLLARYGGEEFMALMVATREAAVKIAERIRFEVELKCVPHHDTSLYRQLTVSIGIAILTTSVRTAEELIEVAHKELRQARRTGKNCVSISRPNKMRT